MAVLTLEWSDDPALCVVMAAKGYPGAYAKGTEIKGLDAAASDPDVQIFHAGTKRDGSRILADGGRVLGVTAKGRDIREAQAKAYAAVDKIDWPGGFCRRDIGWRAVKPLSTSAGHARARGTQASRHRSPRAGRLWIAGATLNAGEWSDSVNSECL